MSAYFILVLYNFFIQKLKVKFRDPLLRGFLIFDDWFRQLVTNRLTHWPFDDKQLNNSNICSMFCHYLVYTGEFKCKDNILLWRKPKIILINAWCLKSRTLNRFACIIINIANISLIFWLQYLLIEPYVDHFWDKHQTRIAYLKTVQSHVVSFQYQGCGNVSWKCDSAQIIFVYIPTNSKKINLYLF